MPDELLLILEKVEKEGKAAPQQSTAVVYVLSGTLSPSFRALIRYLARLVDLPSPLAGRVRHKVLPTLSEGLTHPHSHPVPSLSRN